MARARLLEVTARLVARLGDVGLPLLSDEEFTALLGSLGEVRRAVDSIGAELAAELERRSVDADIACAQARRAQASGGDREADRGGPGGGAGLVLGGGCDNSGAEPGRRAAAAASRDGRAITRRGGAVAAGQSGAKGP